MTTVVGMPVQKRATALAQGSRTRRQNHSCDQCRKSKRACDAVCPSLDLTRRASFSNFDNGQRPPCSYCARTKKRCTMEWARSQAQSALKLSPSQQQQQPYSERSLSRDILLPWNADELQDLESGSVGAWDDLLEPNNTTQELMTWEPANVDLSGSLLDYDDSMPLSSMLNDNEASQEEIQTEMPDALSDLLLPDFSIQQPSDLELDPMYHQTWPPASQGSQTSQTYSNSSQSTS